MFINCYICCSVTVLRWPCVVDRMLKSRYWLTNCRSKCEIGVPLFPWHQSTCTFQSIGLLRGLNHMLSACWFERTFCVHMGVAFSSAPELTNFLRKCWLHKLLLWYPYLKTSVPEALMSKIYVMDVSVFFYIVSHPLWFLCDHWTLVCFYLAVARLHGHFGTSLQTV